MSERIVSEPAMSERSPEQNQDRIRELLDSLYRGDSGRILATLIRLLGDFDLAEEAMHEAFAAALSLWPRNGVPDNPRPWLISTARFKAIDTLRRRARFDASQDELARHLEAQSSSAQMPNAEDSLEDLGLEDDRLRLIFTCCHPSLAPEARVALTLREVCGLTTEEIAKAFLTTPRTLAQRIVRAKAKIREERIPYEVPTPEELPERLGAVLQVVYLVFNEGYSAAAGAEVTRADLTREAIRLGRLLMELRPEPEVMGLLALMLLQESRHAARTSPTGELILLENQDRSLWNREQIAEGVALLEKALGYLAKSGRFGSYTLQAAIGPFMRRRNRSPQPTGSRLLRFTTNCYKSSLRPLSSSIVPWPLRCAMVQRPVSRISTRCWNMVNWRIITWRTPPVPICAAGWAGPPRPVRLTRKRWP